MADMMPYGDYHPALRGQPGYWPEPATRVCGCTYPAGQCPCFRNTLSDAPAFSGDSTFQYARWLRHGLQQFAFLPEAKPRVRVKAKSQRWV